MKALLFNSLLFVVVGFNQLHANDSLVTQLIMPIGSFQSTISYDFELPKSEELTYTNKFRTTFARKAGLNASLLSTNTYPSTTIRSFKNEKILPPVYVVNPKLILSNSLDKKSKNQKILKRLGIAVGSGIVAGYLFGVIVGENNSDLSRHDFGVMWGALGGGVGLVGGLVWGVSANF